MKMLTGALKGRKIFLVPDASMRPTSDLVRKAIFDTLQGTLEDRSVLDIFAGTGALGFEAVSSGARQVVWIESDHSQVRSIERTLASFKLEDRCRVIESDALAALKKLGLRKERYDLIFLDPPYHSGLGVRAVRLIAELELLSSEAIVVLETHKTEDPPDMIGILKTVKIKRHGDTKITFYRQTK